MTSQKFLAVNPTVLQIQYYFCL